MQVSRASSWIYKSIRAVQTSSSSSVSSFNGVIPTENIEKRFSLSSGPGGQNVQKNATKAEIRFKLSEAKWLPEHLKEPLQQRLHSRINVDGEVIIDSDRTRERNLNLADCFDKLRSTIYDVERQLNFRQETDQDREVIRKAAERAAQHRLAEKRKLSEKKRQRASVEF